MTTHRRRWLRIGLLCALLAPGAQQIWRHGRDYVFADQFAVVVPGKIYRGAWQKPWPMRRLVRDYRIKTVLALAHPATHPLSVQERALERPDPTAHDFAQGRPERERRLVPAVVLAK